MKFKSSDLKCDQRIQILLLREVSWSYDQIVSQLQITHHQVQYACETGHPTPKKHPGRPEVLTPDQIQDLIEFIRMFFENCQLSYQQLADRFAWGVSRIAIRNALNKAGYSHYVARPKSPISEKNRIDRLAWA